MSSDGQPQAHSSHDDRPTGILMDLSNVMVRLHKEQFGRGPTQARSYWIGADAICCILEDTLAPAERNLVRMGAHQRLRDTRLYFQFASVREFCEPVEALTGRKVRSYHSSIDTKADGLVIETFVLHPAGYDGPSRIDLAGEDEV